MKKDNSKFETWLENKILMYKTLAPFKDKPLEDILLGIIKSLFIDTEDIEYKLGYLYTAVKNAEEKKFLIDRLKDYQTDFTFNSSTDLGDLRQLLSFELEMKRLQEQAANKDKSDLTVVKMMNEISDTLKELKTKLGISRSQRKTASETAMEYLSRVKKSAAQYINEHRDEFLWKCASCGQTHLLARRHSAYDEHGSIWNMKLIVLYNEGKITLKEVAEVLETSEEYIRLICKRKNIKLRD
jgi:hypothetical protein